VRTAADGWIDAAEDFDFPRKIGRGDRGEGGRWCRAGGNPRQRSALASRHTQGGAKVTPPCPMWSSMASASAGTWA